MIVRKQHIKLPLGPGDKVVAATQLRDQVVIVTERGEIFQVLRERHDD